MLTPRGPHSAAALREVLLDLNGHTQGGRLLICGGGATGIETIPPGNIGAWRIGGVNFTATAATRFEQANAPFAVGVCVEAKYVIDGSVNQLVAVESKPLARCQIGGVVALRAYGPITAFPVGLVGPWMVGGVSYQATASTSFEQRFGFSLVQRSGASLLNEVPADDTAIVGGES